MTEEMKEREQRVRMLNQMSSYGIPDYMMSELYDYIVNKTPPGGFLRAVLSNDLIGAIIAADSINANCLKSYISYLYFYAPTDCYGSAKLVNSWLKSRTTNKGKTK